MRQPLAAAIELVDLFVIEVPPDSPSAQPTFKSVEGKLKIDVEIHQVDEHRPEFFRPILLVGEKSGQVLDEI